MWYQKASRITGSYPVSGGNPIYEGNQVAYRKLSESRQVAIRKQTDSSLNAIRYPIQANGAQSQFLCALRLVHSVIAC
jgi:hypothetical protein